MATEQTKVREKQNSYELVVIFRPELADEKLEAAVENIKKFITGKGGVISEVLKWGKRRLAYPIKHSGEGSYFLLKVQMKPGINRELGTSLRISEDVLRHLLVKTE